ncbi:MAG: class I SAM-dependent methyltransferase [Candidatus Omnitrophica bacterium]|nr:class I SAM-dependent methyltransferase [Candidatus Omnitrophota bacterium]
MHINGLKDTEKTYSLLWSRTADEIPYNGYHYAAMQAVIKEPIVRGRTGIEVGSGSGYDVCAMAEKNPSVKFITIDICDGIYVTAKRVSGLKNVVAVKASALDIPAKDESFDFAYSFGVLHHTPAPGKGLSEISRVLKRGGPAFLYLYEDHSENIFKYIPLKIVTFVRRLTVLIPKRLLYVLAWLASPFVYIIFTVPSKILAKFASTKHVAGQMPFNFGAGPFSLRGDIYDRFAAPIEYRFSRQGVRDMFAKCGFKDIEITRLRDTAGWVVWGYKA